MIALPTEYGPLVHELHRRAAECRQPVNGTFELTSRCNLSCRMCYIGRSAGDRAIRQREMPASAWLSLARQAADNGMVFLLLTGGEVFLRSDFFDIYEPLTRMGLMLTVFTNGTLITNTVAARLAQSPPSRTEITLYGSTARTYEAITGVTGSYARCLAGIEALLTNGVPLLLKTTITRQNVHELDEMRQMAHSWGVLFLAGWLLSKRPDGALSRVDECRLSARNSVDLESNDRASAREWGEVVPLEASIYNSHSFLCQAGKAVFVINPRGEMNTCVDLPLPAVHPLEIGFGKAWEEVQQFVDSAPPMSEVCLACNARIYCNRCPAWSYLENHTLTEPVPYLCEIARARRELYDQPA